MRIRQARGAALHLCGFMLLAALATGCGISISEPDAEAASGSVTATSQLADRPVDKATIVSDFPLSGGSRAQTESMVKAIEMAMAEAEYSAGGIEIEYVSMNDSSAQSGEWDEAKCAQNMGEAAADPDVVAFIGPFNSGCAQAQIKIANQASLAMISPSTTAVGLTREGGDAGEPGKYYPTGKRNFLRVALADDMQAKGAVVWATRHLGVDRAYVLHDKETYGKGIADQFVQAAPGAGVEVVGFEGIDRMASNYRGVTNKIHESGADLVFFGGVFTNNAGQLIKDIRASLGQMAFIGPDGIFDAALIEAGGPATEGVYATFGGLPPEKLGGKGAAFIERYREAHGEPAAYTAYAYDVASVVLDAIDRCGTGEGAVTRACVIRKLFATKDYEGAIGTFSFTPSGDTDFTKLSGFQVQDGEWVFAQELDVAEAGS